MTIYVFNHFNLTHSNTQNKIFILDNFCIPTHNKIIVYYFKMLMIFVHHKNI